MRVHVTVGGARIAIYRALPRSTHRPEAVCMDATCLSFTLLVAVSTSMLRGCVSIKYVVNWTVQGTVNYST